MLASQAVFQEPGTRLRSITMMDVRNFALCAGEFANVPECSWSRSAIDLNSLWDGVQRGFAV